MTHNWPQRPFRELFQGRWKLGLCRQRNFQNFQESSRQVWRHYLRLRVCWERWDRLWRHRRRADRRHQGRLSHNFRFLQGNGIKMVNIFYFWSTFYAAISEDNAIISDFYQIRYLNESLKINLKNKYKFSALKGESLQINLNKCFIFSCGYRQRQKPLFKTFLKTCATSSLNAECTM